MLNLLPVNGPGQSLWVHRAFAVAVATATVAPVEFAYFQSSYAQATATATTSVAAGIIKPAEVQAQGRAAAAVQPTLAYAGSSTAQASAFGLAAVRRDVFAEASATGTSVASALLASDIGEVLAFPQPWVVEVGGGLNGVSFSYLTERGGATALGSAQPTKVHPGHVSDLTASATGTATADVTRWAMVDDAVGAALWTRAEASYMSALDNGFWQDGQTWEDTESWVDAGWYYHDGYVPAGTVAGTATAAIDNTLVTLIETVGPYNLGQSYAVACTGTLRQPASVTATGLATGLADESWLTYANAQATADSTAQAAGVRTCFGAATATAQAKALSTRATTRQISTASGAITATALAPVAVRTCFGAGSSPATATGAATPANFYRDTAAGSGQASGTGTSLQRFAVLAAATGTGTGNVTPADFYQVAATGTLATGTGTGVAVVNHAGQGNASGTVQGIATGRRQPGQTSAGTAEATGTAAASLVYRAELIASSGASGEATYATQHWGLLTGASGASGIAAALMNYRGWVTASAGATATITAFANSDVRAPECRYLIVAADDRTMPIEADDRLLRVTCG